MYFFLSIWKFGEHDVHFCQNKEMSTLNDDQTEMAKIQSDKFGLGEANNNKKTEKVCFWFSTCDSTSVSYTISPEFFSMSTLIRPKRVTLLKSANSNETCIVI